MHAAVVAMPALTQRRNKTKKTTKQPATTTATTADCTAEQRERRFNAVVQPQDYLLLQPRRGQSRATQQDNIPTPEVCLPVHER